MPEDNNTTTVNEQTAAPQETVPPVYGPCPDCNANPDSLATMESYGVDPLNLAEALAQAIGNFVVCEFLIGTQNMIVREGILTHVGMSTFVLYYEAEGTSLLCDLYSVKFVTFYQPGQRPVRNRQQLRR